MLDAGAGVLSGLLGRGMMRALLRCLLWPVALTAAPGAGAGRQASSPRFASTPTSRRSGRPVLELVRAVVREFAAATATSATAAQRPQIYCDGYGRCFERLPDGFGGYSRNSYDRPPGWADDLPGRDPLS